MAPGVSTTVTELPESRVRVQAEVPAEEVERRIASAARELGRSLRVPGFRAGKVPPPVIIKRVGRQAVLDEAVRDALPRWYSAAIDAARIAPVGEPDVDLAELPREGEPLRFSIEIGVRPKAQLGDWRSLEVGRREPAVDDAAVEEELEGLRERTAKLETVERPAASGDFVVMDFLGTLDGEPFPGGEGRDQLVELGSGRLVPGFESQLEGASAGEPRTVTVTFPEDYGAAELAGRTAEFAVTVKEVKGKELPPLDDELAAEAGFDTLDELRADLRERLGEREAAQAEGEFREAVLDAAVAQAVIDVPDALVEARARETWESMVHTLGHQGIDRDTYLRLAGKAEEEIVAEAKPDAEQALKREAVLAALVEAEGVEPTEEELEAALEAASEREGATPRKLLERLRSNGRLDDLRSDLAQRQALDRLVEAVTPVAVGDAEARGALWTPGGPEPAEGAAGGGQQLWTPGSR